MSIIRRPINLSNVYVSKSEASNTTDSDQIYDYISFYKGGIMNPVPTIGSGINSQYFAVKRNTLPGFLIDPRKAGLIFVPGNYITSSLSSLNNEKLDTNRSNIDETTIIKPLGLSFKLSSNFQLSDNSFYLDSNSLIKYTIYDEHHKYYNTTSDRATLGSKDFDSGYNNIVGDRSEIYNLQLFTNQRLDPVIPQSIISVPSNPSSISFNQLAVDLSSYNVNGHLSTTWFDFTKPDPKVTNTFNEIIIGNAFTFTQEQLNTANPLQDKAAIQGTTAKLPNGGAVFIPGGLVDFRKTIRERVLPTGTTNKIAEEKIKTVLPSIFVNYDKYNMANRINIGDPGNKSLKNISDYDIGAGGGAASPNSYDKLNSGEDTKNNGVLYPDNDLVHFIIGVYSYESNSWFNYQFRAFLNGISDDYSAQWNSQRYIGRGENFYTYAGFDRKISLSWTVAAQSKREMLPMYKRLNQLASICAPDYAGGRSGYMKGPISRLRIGHYVGYNRPLYGIITKVAYEISEDSTWDINIDADGVPGGGDKKQKRLVGELPHMIKVSSFEFIPIHVETPQLFGNFIN